MAVGGMDAPGNGQLVSCNTDLCAFGRDSKTVFGVDCKRTENPRCDRVWNSCRHRCLAVSTARQLCMRHCATQLYYI